MSKKKTIDHKPNHYVNNREFYEAIVGLWDAWEKNGERPNITDYVGTCLLKIAEKLASRYNFANYTYRDEMVSDAYTNMVSAFWNFSPKKSKVPFLYFSTIAYNAMVRRITLEKEETYIKHAYMDHVFTVVDDLFDEAGHSGGNVNNRAGSKEHHSGVQHHYDVLKNWEEMRARHKAKKKPNKRKKAPAKKKLTRRSR